MLVMLKLPAENVFVGNTVQLPNGNVRLVVVSTLYCSPASPFVPLITRLEPDSEMPVIAGCGTTGPATTLKTPAASVFVFHASPGPGVAGTMLVNKPL